MNKLLIEDFASVKGGKRLPKGHTYSKKQTNFPYLRVKDFGEYTVKDTDLKFLEKETQELISRYTISDNDIYISIAGTIGRVGFIPEHLNGANLTENAAKITDIKGFDKRFLVYYLSSIVAQNQISLKTKSTSQPKLAIYRINSIETPIFSFVEQKAIVKKIEELFSSLDSGIADLKKAQAQLKIYRQAVLKKAFEGIKDFKSLKECGDWKGGGTPSKRIKEYWENGNIPWVSSRDVKTKEIHDTERHITELAIPNSSTKWIEKNSLLFVMRSGILRRIFPIAIAKTKLCVNQDIQTVSLDENWNAEYVYWFLVGNESDIRHSCSKDGTTVESIDANSLKSYLIPICDLKQQQQIVREIESRLSVCDNVEESIKESLEKAQALRQSILKKAFEGKLLSAEEIAKCKADTEYEPASVLLEKIKMEKK